MRVAASEAKAKEANAARLPTLKFGAGYTRLSQVPPFEVSLPILPTKFVVSQNYFNNYLIKIGLQQPLFTGFKLESAADMAGFNMKAAEQDMAMDRADLVYDIRAAYWNLYQAREFVKVVDESEAQIQAHLSDVKNMFDQGLMTRNEVLRAEVQLSNVRLARIDAGNAVEMAGVVLNSLLGLPLDTEVALATEIPIRPDGKTRSPRAPSPPRIRKASRRRRRMSGPTSRPWSSASRRRKPGLRRPKRAGIPRFSCPEIIMI